MKKCIYLRNNKKLDFYVNYIDNTAELYLNNNECYSNFGYIVIDILNDYYDFMIDNNLEYDKISIILFNNKKDRNFKFIDINPGKYNDKNLTMEEINEMINNDCNINKYNNFYINVNINLIDSLILF